MSVAIVTGSSGLVGSEAVKFLANKFDKVIGIDNDSRKYFFGESASTKWNAESLKSNFSNFQNLEIDIRDYEKLNKVFSEYNEEIGLIIHAAAQPSHDWAAKEPITDFTINANGTLNLLELARKYSPKTVFIYTSTNKVYGDTPNKLPLIEKEKRFEISEEHRFFQNGIDESMNIDQSLHSLFGGSKLAADIMVQEYGRYFGMKTGVFRGGCLTGPGHSGAKLHGFLSYLMNCTINDIPYTILGYKGKQVRDNIHSFDLLSMFWQFYLNPMQGEVYNVGGGMFSNCSMIEGIELCQKIADKKLNYSYSEKNRSGDHIWYISDTSKFKAHYPEWNYTYNLEKILLEIHDGIVRKLRN